MDNVDPSVRSRIMASVPQKSTKPEVIVRKLAHSLGYRFRLHQSGLPGTPDMVFPRLRKVVFVHGCFWHRHGCRQTTNPASNIDFWIAKFKANRLRDRRAIRLLKSNGWQSLVVWECQTKKLDWLRTRLAAFLDD